MKTIKIISIVLLIKVMLVVQCAYAQKPVTYVQNGQLKKVQAFAKKGGDLGAVYEYLVNNSEPVEGYLLNYAYAMNQTEIFECLLDEIKDLHNYKEQLNTTLTLMVDEADIATMQRFIELGADINSRCILCNGSYPLLQALQYENREVIDYILSLKPDLTVVNFYNCGVLHHTAIGGHYDLLVRFFEEEGLDIWECHPEDNILFYAAANNNTDILRYLVDNMKHDDRFEAYLQDEFGFSFLHYAATSNPENIQIVLGFTEEIDLPDNDGWRPLHHAAETSLENVKTLVNAGADVYVIDNDGYNILHIACEFGMSDIVDYLLNNCKMDISAETYGEYTPLMLAVFGGDLKTVQVICEHDNFDFIRKKEVLQMAKEHKDIYRYLKTKK